ncbi:hypothetical protein N234_35155 [Ralstonia pickettii DTP0602]|nr:hypothetical protein N234_35155 [Ralstonia pickettii DTP0602]
MDPPAGAGTRILTGLVVHAIAAGMARAVTAATATMRIREKARQCCMSNSVVDTVCRTSLAPVMCGKFQYMDGIGNRAAS